MHPTHVTKLYHVTSWLFLFLEISQETILVSESLIHPQGGVEVMHAP